LLNSFFNLSLIFWKIKLILFNAFSSRSCSTMSAMNRLQFIIEFENNRNINFLDLSLYVVDNKIKINWFHKKTFSGRFLCYFSNHPLCQKIGTIYNLIDRAILLSHPNFQEKKLYKITLRKWLSIEFNFPKNQ